MLLPPDRALATVTDDFRVGLLRVRLHGSALDITPAETSVDESSLVDSIQNLAAEYANALSRAGLFGRFVPESEWLAATAPPFQTNFEHFNSRGDRDEIFRIRRIIRSARSEVVSDPALRRAYDYMQDAHERSEIDLPLLYKTIETIEHEFRSSERDTLRALGVDYRPVKRLANTGSTDERHAPPPGVAATPPSNEARVRAFETVKELIEAYANYRG